jgi:hypothetical protein
VRQVRKDQVWRGAVRRGFAVPGNVLHLRDGDVEFGHVGEGGGGDRDVVVEAEGAGDGEDGAEGELEGEIVVGVGGGVVEGRDLGLGAEEGSVAGRTDGRGR